MTRVKSRQSGKDYVTVLLRQSYREGGKVKSRTLGNLTHCTPDEIAAVALALKFKDDPESMRRALTGEERAEVEVTQGPAVGVVAALAQVARRLGLDKALGAGPPAALALWQVLARLIDQGSRLSAVRLAQSHAACDVLGMDGFNEDALYENLAWLSEHREEIEKRLFKARRAAAPQLFLYDVTSSYLEGTQNELAAFGYNRDRKRGKMQIVIGLLCDDEGEPVSATVFRGNTLDTQTFGEQIKTVAERFGCERVTMVGDRGMIKGGQIQDLDRAGFFYITAITKPQIRAMVREKTLQLEMFDENLAEIQSKEARYVLRRNPKRAEEIAASREDKRKNVQRLVEKKNEYLRDHSRAQPAVALKEVAAKIVRLNLDGWLAVELEGRKLTLKLDEAALREAAQLDGCYAIKTNLDAAAAPKELIHERYKDLIEVERAFRTCKTGHLEVRPVYVRSEASTRGHVLVVMLAYIIERELRRCWASLDLTVEEGLARIGTLCAVNIKATGLNAAIHQIPVPRQDVAQLLDAAKVHLPRVLPCRGVTVVTRRKLTERRLKN